MDLKKINFLFHIVEPTAAVILQIISKNIMKKMDIKSFDFYNIKLGADWLETIRNSITESDIVAVIVTRSALRSSEIEKEKGS